MQYKATAMTLTDAACPLSVDDIDNTQRHLRGTQLTNTLIERRVRCLVARFDPI